MAEIMLSEAEKAFIHHGVQVCSKYSVKVYVETSNFFAVSSSLPEVL